MPTTIYFPLGSTPAPAQTSPAIAFTAAAYLRQLKLLLPPGLAFNLESSSNITKTLDAIAQELARADARGVDLVKEADPRTVTETVGEWEEMLGLPDEQIVEIPGTIEERRVAVTSKYVERGGADPQFYFDLCAACGYTLVSIDRFADSVLRSGSLAWPESHIFRVDDRVYGEEWAYAMRLNIDLPAGPGALSQADFERVIRHATHSHIVVVFSYS